MKKAYEAPAVEKVEFKYRDQVVVASAGIRCSVINEYRGTNVCHVSDAFPMDTTDSVD